MFAGDVVEAMCSGVWGIVDHGSSFRLTDEEEDRCVVERRTLGRNARMRETKWCRKIDMVTLDDESDSCSSSSGVIEREGHVNTFNHIREKHPGVSHSMMVLLSMLRLGESTTVVITMCLVNCSISKLLDCRLVLLLSGVMDVFV
jgi:hypothetical protein